MLKKLLDRATTMDADDIEVRQEHKHLLDIIVDNACSGRQKAVLAVTLTLLLKKHISPEQDIRYHMDRMEGGFSGRGLDHREVTPFLKKEDFPYMASGSGWLTRSLEQAVPYTLEYTGAIKPPELKTAFLTLVNDLPDTDVVPYILYVLRKLFDWRMVNASITLAKPTNRSIMEIIHMVEEHWNAHQPGVAKIPVIAIWAAYKCLLSEVCRFRDCSLDEIRSHTSADKDRWMGDVQIIGIDGNPVEAVEIKHNINLSVSLVAGFKNKIAGSGLSRFYILSTREDVPAEDLAEITEILIEIRSQYGCQVIINGVSSTLKYYLRLIKSPDQFIREYATAIESDKEIPYPLKIKWNELNSYEADE
ncbi:MAG: hypothetical protein OXF84_06500 [Bacteroidetes bacterium]|nr:hypothetical protein [Bacteroidota bacterium]